ncbi:mitotic checkpoint serine/threonine-protein kinase BUB1 beta-like isoform X2 [Hypomesus transpacificus]|uniref:mitotic checkpoint serine/threonine-protein kinase BUB1 beta-like isoform X2 n=1 Tax=Hypomesus transpacificus TaxID=137520 RepID=UPI001F0743BF|nr:mitotic checkpoint serine/threonine-protein kinase BUB1 beta-like isoform X2 [Hypomesus transpacificus]
MAEGGAEWEFYKENMLPSGEGRGVTALQEEARHAATKQRQAFEWELCMYTGGDPLDVWDRYIRWTAHAYPQGSKESNLTDLLERAVQLFVDDERYSDDSRYVDIWLKLAQNSTGPENTYSYMQAQGIGVTRAAFYIAWSEEYEKHGDYQKADVVLQNGLKSGAQPVEKLRQYHKGLQDRASCHAKEGVAKGAQEEETPPRCLVDLRPRRGKRSVAPMNRGQSGGLDKQDTRSSQNAPMAIFDENQIGCSSVEAPPSKNSFQHYVEGDQMPSVAAHKRDPEVNMDLFTLRPAKEESALECQPKQQTQSQVAGGAKEQSMYCKELIHSGVIELSFEELRAQRYYKCISRGLDEKFHHLSKVEEDLKQKIEAKQRDLQLRKSQHAQHPQDVTIEEESSHTPAAEPGSGSSTQQPFQIFVDSPSGSSGNSNLCQNAAPTDDVFYPLGENAMSIRIQYPRSKDGKVPLNEQAQMSKSFPEKTETLTDEAIVYGHNNKTLCASPDDTNDFALANKMASTPYTGTLGHRMSLPNTGSLTKDIRDTAVNVGTPQPEVDSRKTLSPIQEAALEASMVSSKACASLLGVQSEGKAMNHLSRLEESQADLEIMNQTVIIHSPPEDPCSLNTRLQLLKQFDLRAFPNYHSEPGALPMVEEDEVLFLGNETFFVSSKILERDNFSIYSGQCGEHVTIKVERSTAPWDFYISSRLRERLAKEPQAPAYDPGRHFLFQDGCITVHKAYALQMSELWSNERCLASLAMGLVELVRRMHSSSLVHGVLSPDTLLFSLSQSLSEDDHESIVALDLSNSLDLELQRDITTVEHLPAAQAYITRGLLAPSASPYQVDLVGIAETIYTMLTKKSMHLVKDGPEYTVEEYSEAHPSGHSKAFWSKFFHTILNPRDKPSVSVLTELLGDMKMADFAVSTM